MRGILDNYVAAHKKSRGRKMRALVALFLLSAMVASSVVWSLRLIGTTLSAVPVYKASPQAVKRTSPVYRDEELPLSPSPGNRGAAPLSPTAKGLPTMGAQAAHEKNVALNKDYTSAGSKMQPGGGGYQISGNYYPDMGQLTDGVFEKDNATDLLDLKEGTYVGFNSGLGTPTFEVTNLGSATVADVVVSKIKVHYRRDEGGSIGKPAKITYTIGSYAAVPVEVDGGTSDGVHTAEISPAANNTGSSVKLVFDFEGTYDWIFISEIEIFVSRDADPGLFRVQYYGYVDELVTSTDTSTAALPSPDSGTNIASAPPPNGMHTMALNPNLPQMGAKAVSKQTISSIENDGSTATLSVNGVAVSGNIGVLTDGTLASNASVNLDQFLRSNGTNSRTQLKITLSGKKRIDRVVAHFPKTFTGSWAGVYDITLEASNDGSTWTSVASNVSGSLNVTNYYNVVTVTPSGNVDTKWLRLSYTGGSWSNGLYEVEVYGDEIPPENVAYGKQYKYSVAPFANYSDGGTANVWHTGLLTNGDPTTEEPGQAGACGVTNGYVGYISKMTDYTVTVDLGAMYDISLVKMDIFWNESDHYSKTSQPIRFDCAYSADGENWSSETSMIDNYDTRPVYHDTNTQTRTAKIHKCATAGTGVRYVRFTISTDGTYPRLYMDEIEIIGVEPSTTPAVSENWALASEGCVYKGTEGMPQTVGSNYHEGYYDENTTPSNAAWTDWHSGELNDDIFEDGMGTSAANHNEVGISKVWNSNTLQLTFKLTKAVNITNVSAYFLPRTDPNIGYPDKIDVKVGTTDDAANATYFGSYEFNADSTPKYPSGATHCRVFAVTKDEGVYARYVFITITVNSTVDHSNGVTNITEIQVWGVEDEAPPAATYSVTVNGGTADVARAEAGETVRITANDPPAGQTFDHWEVTSGGASLADANAASTTFAMPAADVSITAHFKDIATITGNLAKQGAVYKGISGSPFIIPQTGTSSPHQGYDDNDVSPAGAPWTDWHTGELNDGLIDRGNPPGDGDPVWCGTSDDGHSEVGLQPTWARPANTTVIIAFKLDAISDIDSVSAFMLPRLGEDNKPHYPEGIEVKVGDTDDINAATSIGSCTYEQSSTGPEDAPSCRKFEVNPEGTVRGQYVFITVTISSESKAGQVTNISEIQILGTTTGAAPTYTVTVHHGTGGGSYHAGETVTITADDPEPGKVFEHWEKDPDDLLLANDGYSTTTFVMPAEDVVVTAMYKDAESEARIEYVIDTRRNPDTDKPFYGNRVGNVFKPGGSLPMNDPADQSAENYNLMTVYLEGDTNLSKPKTVRKLVRIYRDNWYYMEDFTGIGYVDILASNADWVLKAVWKLTGADPESTIESDWDKTTGAPDQLRALEFNVGGENDYALSANDTIRLVFDPNIQQYTHETPHFFDYDITNGPRSETDPGAGEPDAYNTSRQNNSNVWHGLGINEPYPMVEFFDPTDPNGTSHTGDPFFAFGNANTGVCYQYLYWKDKNDVWNQINKSNSNNKRPRQSCTGSDDRPTTKSRNGATFGLVKEHLLTDTGSDAYKYNNGLDFNVRTSDSGFVNRWNPGGSDAFAAPSMFQQATSGSKRRYFDDMTLTFNQRGDTYTLSSVGKYGGSKTEYLNRLEYLNSNGVASGTKDLYIWANDFWPLSSDERWGAGSCVPETGSDTGPAAKDPLFYKVADNPSSGKHWYGVNGMGAYFPAPDNNDKSPTNSYFGMNFDVEFTLTDDYVGPLNYFFYGDDDLWVYLDGILVCDIGGVHSSIGEYVNLWDTLSPYSIGAHKLSVFYTERGASGSSCYMRFNLPGVTVQPPPAEYSALIISKEGDGTVGTESFTYELCLKQQNNTPYDKGHPLLIYDSYSEYYTSQGSVEESSYTTTSGAVREITLKPGQMALIDKLPGGLKYTLTEKNTTGYVVSAKADRVEAVESYPTGPPTLDARLATVGADRVYESVPLTEIVAGAKFSCVHFINSTSSQLPNTGGVGGELLPVLGLTAVIFSSLAPVVLRDDKKPRSRKRRREDDEE